MNSLTENRRQNLASVKRIISEWELGGLLRVENFLNKPTTIIEPNSFAEKIKKLLSVDNRKHWISVGAEIKTLKDKFKLT